MHTLYFILFLAGFVCFVVSAVGLAPRLINLVPVGLACVTLVWVIQQFRLIS